MELPTYDDFPVGRRGSFTKTLTEADVALFVGITGDVNPLHVDEEFASRTHFQGRIVQGLLSASLLSTVIGCEVPGVGAIYRSQTLHFRRPVRIGDTLTAAVEVTGVDAEAEEIVLASTITNQRGETVVDGESTVSLLRGLRD